MGRIRNLEDLRKSKGITASYVSNQLRISRPTLKAKENRKSPVSVLEADFFARLYSTDIEEIEKLCRIK